VGGGLAHLAGGRGTVEDAAGEVAGAEHARGGADRRHLGVGPRGRRNWSAREGRSKTSAAGWIAWDLATNLFDPVMVWVRSGVIRPAPTR